MYQNFNFCSLPKNEIVTNNAVWPASEKDPLNYSINYKLYYATKNINFK